MSEKNPHDGSTLESLLREEGTYDTARESALLSIINQREEELIRLKTMLNTPIFEDFVEGFKREAAYQIKEWGESLDRHKEPQEWYWLLAYLSGKGLRAQMEGDLDKARHHCISSAAVLLNWHRSIGAENTGEESDLRKKVEEDFPEAT